MTGKCKVLKISMHFCHTDRKGREFVSTKRILIIAITILMFASSSVFAAGVEFRPVTEGVDITVKDYPKTKKTLDIYKVENGQKFCIAKINLRNGSGSTALRDMAPGVKYELAYPSADRAGHYENVSVTIPAASARRYTSVSKLSKAMLSDMRKCRKNTYFLQTGGKGDISAMIDKYLYDNKGKKIGSFYYNNLAHNSDISLEGRSSNGYVYRISTNPVVRMGGSNTAIINKGVSKASAIVKKLPLKGKSKKQKCYTIAKYLAKHCRYCDGGSSKYYTAYGALCQGKANCVGYSEAYMLMCNAAGVDTVIVGGMRKGTGHRWVLQNIGGKTYSSDLVFADMGKDISKMWLLRGKSDKRFHKGRKYFDGWRDGLYGFSVKMAKKSL